MDISHLTDILNKAAQNLNLRNFSFNLKVSAQKGDGFLSEMYKASLLDDDTNTKIDLIIKKAPKEKKRRDETCIDNAYKNEIFFYEKLMPALRKFQNECQICDIFDSVPSYIAGVGEIGTEVIVLEDITNFGYQMREKDLILNEEHARFIFQTYGRFHALSFCLKQQKPEEYGILTNSCANLMEEFADKYGFSYSLKKIVERSFEALDPNQNKSVRKKFEKYVDGTMEMFKSSIKYEGKFAGILHGDCWSNNVMFKYKDPQNKTQIESLKLLDFQMIWIGTPVYDLSYFFYSGGSKELFVQLEYYLDLYYESFSNFTKKLGCDPSKILPRKILTEDWKKYSKFGMLMAILLTRVKLISRELSAEIAEMKDEDEYKFINARINEDEFDKRISNLLVHMDEIEAL